MRLLVDENFHGDVLRGLLRVEPRLDIVRVQDTEIYQAADPVVLEWAAKEDRILLTHDVKTMTKYTYDRIQAGLPMPGVIELRDNLPIGQAIEEIMIVLFASLPGELANKITYLPLS
jgi:predicted nuclease of predicted toxin-antitoxin system